MKNLIKLLGAVIFSVTGVFFLQKIAFAASIEVSDYATFKSYANNGGDIKLTSDIEIVANTFVKKEFTLDLNGHTINVTNSAKLIINDTTLTINDSSSDNSGTITGNSNYYFRVGNSAPGIVFFNNGTIYGDYGVLIASGSFTMNGGKITSDNTPVLAQGGNFTMNDGLVEANTGIALRGYAADSTITVNGGKVVTYGDQTAINSSKGSDIVINGGLIEALNPGPSEGRGGIGISVYKDGSATINGGTIHSASSALISNGSIEDWNSSNGMNAKFTITGGELISDKHSGIYAPQFDGVTTITGGTITGRTTAIELRAGSLSITGGTLTALYDTFEAENNTSGTTTKGAAVAIAQHTTKNNMNINICGGTFRGAVALAEINPNGNSPEDIAKITLLIDEPCGDLSFESTSISPIVSEDFTDFIKGGTFNHSVAPFIHSDYEERVRNGKFVVVNKNTPEDTEDADNNPNTYDNINCFIVLTLALLGFSSIIAIKKR